MNNDTIAFGAPGIEPRWTSSAKDGVGTAYHSSSRVWFTLSHGIINEIYFPFVDTPNTRDLQFLITDGETFCHEEKRDLLHRIECPEKNALLYRLTNSDPAGRYRLIKEIVTDPHSPAEYRVNGTVRNVPEFYSAFGVKPGDKMYLPPEQRVKIW